MTRRWTIALAGLTAAAALGIGAAASGPAVSQSRTQLRGTLVLTPGKAVGRRYTGTYFRMLLPGRTDQYFANPDSRARNKTYTLLRPGRDGGLRLGRYQPPPRPPFARNGDSLARRVTLPERFASIKFSISTAARDGQSGAAVPAPSLVVRGSKITGDVRAWTATWNKIYFNQGAPKPNGAYPALTRPVTGRYDRRSKRFTITWYSAIVGGPFNGFTGYWHLQGKLRS